MAGSCQRENDSRAFDSGVINPMNGKSFNNLQGGVQADAAPLGELDEAYRTRYENIHNGNARGVRKC